MSKPHFVIAKYKENVDWAKKYGLDCSVISKEIDLLNSGREVSSYFFFIMNNYDVLEGDYVFCQGNPFDHDGSFMENVEKQRYYGLQYNCDKDGCPNHCGLPIEFISKALDLPVFNHYEFKAGGQFRISATEIKRYSLEWYKRAFELSVTNHLAPYVFERIWPVIYNLE